MNDLPDNESMLTQIDQMQAELQELKQSNPGAYLELLNKLNALLEELNSEFEAK